MYRKQDSLEQGLVTPPAPAFTPTTQRKVNDNNIRPELQHRRNRSQPLFWLPGDSGGGDCCLSRTPFASLCAFLCCMFGVLLFATMMVWAFAASVEQSRRAFRVNNLPWLDKVNLFFIVSASAMVAVSLAFLLVGLLSTGPTRHAVFAGGGGGVPGVGAGAAARRGGRISCVVAICLSFVLNLLWTTIAIFTAILCFIYTILLMLCSDANECLDFAIFASLFRVQNNTSLKFCGGELQQFCAVTNTVIVWYFVGLLGSVIVCAGLVQFIVSNAANYAHIGSEAKYAELRHLFYSEINANHQQQGANTMPMDQFCNSIDRRYCSNSYYNNRDGHSGGDRCRQQRSWQQQPTPAEQNSGRRRNDCAPPTHRHWKEEAAASADECGRNGVPPTDHYHRHPQIERRTEKRSVGAAVASVRRNSYQNSLHGSNSWLNYAAGGDGIDDPSSAAAVGRRVMY